MNNLDQAVQTQLNNIQKKTGKSLTGLSAFIRRSGLTKHGEIRDMLKEKPGLGHGDANALVHAVFESDGTRGAQGKSENAVRDGIYSGAKAVFRPIHEKLIKEITGLGKFEIAPKKGYFGLRRKKQFAKIGPRTNTRFEVGIKVKDLGKNPACRNSPRAACAITSSTRPMSGMWTLN